MSTKFTRCGIRPTNGEYIYYASTMGEYLIRQIPLYHTSNLLFGTPYHRPSHRFQLFSTPILDRIYSHPTRRIRASF